MSKTKTKGKKDQQEYFGTVFFIHTRVHKVSEEL